ncbi:MAG: helix-turn-helix domain-containing protein [Actinobacteria bacterium]|nr:helix-turn-helix domain-containing protein [Actinomycetota bacterium]
MSELKDKIGERIKEFAELKFQTQKNLCEALGMMPQTLQQYVSGKTMPGGEVIKKLADLGADIHYLLTGEKLKEKIASDVYREAANKTTGYDFPIVSMLSAGSMVEFFTDEHSEKVAFTYHKKLGCMALRVKGDSMSPTIENGDLVLVDSDARLYDGCIVAARLKSGDQVIKRFRILPHELIQLDSDNFLYDPITLKKEEVELVMPVVKIQREIYKV